VLAVGFLCLFHALFWEDESSRPELLLLLFKYHRHFIVCMKTRVCDLILSARDWFKNQCIIIAQ